VVLIFLIIILFSILSKWCNFAIGEQKKRGQFRPKPNTLCLHDLSLLGEGLEHVYLSDERETHNNPRPRVPESCSKQNSSSHSKKESGFFFG
jgi:hypothetical protein